MTFLSSHLGKNSWMNMGVNNSNAGSVPLEVNRLKVLLQGALAHWKDSAALKGAEL